MNHLNIQLNRLPKNTIKSNYFNKTNKIPNRKNINNGFDNNYMTYYNQYSLNNEKCTKINPNKKNSLNSYHLKSHGNIQQNNNIQDIDILKIKMGFDLINQKINNMESIIQSLNDSNEPNYDYNIIDDNNYRIKKIPLRDQIRYKKEIIKKNNMKRQKNLNNEKNFTKIEPIIDNGFVQHNYSVQNLKDKGIYNININDYSKQKKNGINNNYNNFYSLQQEKSNIQNRTRYNSYNNLNILNSNEQNIYNERNKLINANNKSANSLSNRHIPNQKRKITKKIISNKYFFDNINKVPSLRNNIKKNINSNNFQNNYFNDIIINDNQNDDQINDDINNLDSNIINKYIGEYYGSFDEYFLSDFQQSNPTKTKKGKENNQTKNNNLNNKNINVNELKQNNNNKNSFNIYNIVKNDKIIQNNYYETKNKSINKNLVIQNQNNFSFCIKNIKKLNEDENHNIEQKKLNKEFTRNKFGISQLKKCTASDFFLPNKNNKNLKDIISIDNSKKEKVEIDNKLIKTDIKIKETQNKKNSIKCKDDFYYDLFMEKIFDTKKINNSFEENNLLPKIKKRFFENSDKRTINKINYKENNNRKKGVRFFESDNKIIKINQNDIATKFEVLNNFGKKIYFKKCKINDYLNKLKNKNLKLKSILINKKEEFVDNSEWDKLYDIINQIAKRNEKQKSNNDIKNKNKNKIGKFLIKNIESFKKNGKKVVLKNNKYKK